MKQPELEFNKLTFRVKKMNAIEALALRTASSLQTTKEAMKFFYDVLERIEVSVGGKWLPVKSGDNFYPADIENDAQTIQTLINFFMSEFLKPLFTKSDE